mmetsp:Transcript_22114/g.32963  ORF Transcript_22114/g.32963 Transcript_22114/m.32963 type:complete len:422 (+) Transcript_22114:51-1316(+)
MLIGKRKCFLLVVVVVVLLAGVLAYRRRDDFESSMYVPISALNKIPHDEQSSSLHNCPPSKSATLQQLQEGLAMLKRCEKRNCTDSQQIIRTVLSVLSISHDARYVTLSEAKLKLRLLRESFRSCGARINFETLTTRYLGPCKHKGKVFGIGLFKTGTSSLMQAFVNLGYQPDNLTKTFDFSYTGSNQFDESMVLERIDESTRTPPYVKVLDSAQSAVDGPWLFLYERLSMWYPNSKFVYTVRDTVGLLRSDLGMWMKGKPQKIFDLDVWKLWDMQRRGKQSLIYGHSIIDFLLLIFRRQAMHKERVLKHFSGSERSDLFILNISSTPYSSFARFLGCPLNGTFAHKNTANKSNHDRVRHWITKDMIEDEGILNWRRYHFIEKTQKTLFEIHPKTGPMLLPPPANEYVCTYCPGWKLKENR